MEQCFRMDKKKSKLVGRLLKFKNKNHLEKMYLFGSRAWGNPHKWSDVDLLVVSKKFRGKGPLQRSPPLYLDWNLNSPVDFLCYTPEEFNKLKKQITIVREAVEKGLEIK